MKKELRKNFGIVVMLLDKMQRSVLVEKKGYFSSNQVNFVRNIDMACGRLGEAVEIIFEDCKDVVKKKEDIVMTLRGYDDLYRTFRDEKEYKLEDTKLVVLQGMNNEAVDVTSIRAMVMEDFYKNSEQRLQQQAVKISQLETTLEQYRTYDAMSRTLVPELKVLYPSITTLSIAHSLEVRVDSMKTDTVTLAVLKFDRHPSAAEKQKISEWLKARVGAKKLRLITE